jgi:hypothetical protein
MVQMGKETIRFSIEFWQKELKGAERIRIMYDKDTNQVGLLPGDPGESIGLIVHKDRSGGGTMSIYIKGFNKALCLAFDKPCNYTIINVGSQDHRMRIFDLNQNCKKG